MVVSFHNVYNNETQKQLLRHQNSGDLLTVSKLHQHRHMPSPNTPKPGPRTQYSEGNHNPYHQDSLLARYSLPYQGLSPQNISNEERKADSSPPRTFRQDINTFAHNSERWSYQQSAASAAAASASATGNHSFDIPLRQEDVSIGNHSHHPYHHNSQLPVAAALLEATSQMPLFMDVDEDDNDHHYQDDQDMGEPLPYAQGNRMTQYPYSESERLTSSDREYDEMDTSEDAMTATKQDPGVEGQDSKLPPADTSANPGQPNRPLRIYQCGKWHQKFDVLLNFKKEHGHCNVPHNWQENPSLARWVKRQRHQYRLKKEGQPSTMTRQRLEALQSVGFVWDVYESGWEEKLAELVVYKNKYHHTNVPCNFPENQPLAVWVKCQRRQYKLHLDGQPSSMNAERIQRLQDIGFKWGLRNYKKRKTTKMPSADSTDQN